MQTTQQINDNKKARIQTITSFLKPLTVSLLQSHTSIVRIPGRTFIDTLYYIGNSSTVEEAFTKTTDTYNTYTENIRKNLRRDPLALGAQMMDFEKNTEALSYSTKELFKNAWKNSKGDLDDFTSEVQQVDDKIPVEDISREYDSRQQEDPMIILEHIDLSDLDMFKEQIREKYPSANEGDIRNLFESFNALEGQSLANLSITTLEAVTECITRIEEQNRSIITERNRRQKGNQRQGGDQSI